MRGSRAEQAVLRGYRAEQAVMRGYRAEQSVLRWYKEEKAVIRGYTVTRPYEGFRHPDWMAPESTVRGRENDSLVMPGYIHPQLPSFSGSYGIFRRLTLRKKDRVMQ